jgi:two-component system alkaline phosphatase synthesis response regulator PhoP
MNSNIHSVTTSKLHSLLIVEDEKHLGETLLDYWRERGVKVSWAQSCNEAQKYFLQDHFEVVLMDINLPDGNGLELAKMWRQSQKSLILLFLSAQNDPSLKVESFDIGAHDYITKPFHLKELTHRLERIFGQLENRKTTAESTSHLFTQGEEWSFGPLRFWPTRFEVQDAQGQIQNWGQKEVHILEFLLRRSPEAVSREELLEEIWGLETFPTNRTVDNYIVKIRRWCESDSEKHLQIHSIRGVGYKLEKKDTIK